MSSRKQNGSRFLFSPEPRDFVTNVTLVQRNGERDWRDLTRNTRERHVMCIPFILPTRQILGIRRGRYRHGGRRVAGMFEVNLVFYWFIVVQWGVPSPEVSMNIRTAKVWAPWFAILSIEGHPNSCRTSFFVVGMIYSLLIAIIPSAEYFGQQLLFKRKYRRVVPIHGHLHWHLKREVSRSRKEFKIAIIFRRRSREDSLFQAVHYLKAWGNTEATEKKGVDLWKQMSSKLSDRLHFLAEYFDLNPYPSATTVYARSAFYPNLRFTLSLQSAFSLSLHFTPGPQSAVCSPQSAFYTDRLKYINGYNWWSAGELWGSVYIQG